MHFKVTQYVAKYPPHHMTYAPAKFEVATSNGLREDTITINMTDTKKDNGPTMVRN